MTVRKVLALGGAGAMGVHACRTVAKAYNNIELRVTDLDAHRATEVAASLDCPATGSALDVTDSAALADAMGDADLVMNTVGPFFRFGVPILRASIAAGCDYVDICDDWEPTLEMLELDAAARSAGITALVGMGASPGLANLLALVAARDLDHVDDLVTGWDLTAGGLDPVPAAKGPSAAVVHAIAQVTGTIRVTRHGRPTDEPALRRTTIDYPGAGRRTTWTFGHPEPLTLPAALPDLTTSVNVTFADRGIIAGLRALRVAVDRRLLSPRRAALIVDRLDRRFPTPPAKSLRGDRLPPLFALAVGRRDGQAASVGCGLAQIPGGLTMGEVTGIPLGLAVGLLPAAPGVHAPETLLDPTEFFAALAPHCLGDPRPEEMVVTTRSWDPASTDHLKAALDRARSLAAG